MRFLRVLTKVCRFDLRTRIDLTLNYGTMGRVVWLCKPTKSLRNSGRVQIYHDIHAQERGISQGREKASIYPIFRDVAGSGTAAYTFRLNDQRTPRLTDGK
jgi:hypothetical protein